MYTLVFYIILKIPAISILVDAAIAWVRHYPYIGSFSYFNKFHNLILQNLEK